MLRFGLKTRQIINTIKLTSRVTITNPQHGIQFKGSQIDRSLSYGNINKQLISNSQQETLANAFRRTARENAEQRSTSAGQSNIEQQEPGNDTVYEQSDRWFIEDIAAGFGGGGDVDDDAYKRKKRNKDNDNPISR
jgi:hypothetical protein